MNRPAIKKRNSHEPEPARSTVESKNSDKKDNPVCPPEGSRDQRPVLYESLAEDAGKAGNTVRCVVIVTSFRTKLLDRENLWGGVKYFVDSLRYSKLITDDSESHIDLKVYQVKVATRKEEATKLEVIYEPVNW